MPKHILSGEDLSLNEINEIFTLADKIPTELWYWQRALTGKILGTLFFEPSMRTRWSTETAMLRLGGNVVSMENGSLSSSVVKGETLEDTFKVCSQYVDIIATRHPNAGSIQKAAQYSDVPVINAGDGDNEHPTQGLLDLLTIQQHFSDMDNLKIMFTGDLTCSRTMRSLTQMLKHYNTEVFYEDVNKIPDMDVVYLTRHQTERNRERVKSNFVMTNKIAETMKPNAIILHPLPRTEELLPEVDTNPRSKYFQQVKNGIFVRMALIYWLLKKF